MTEATIAETASTATGRPAVEPPRVPAPKLLQGLGFALCRRWMTDRFRKRYGDVYTMNLPVFGHMVSITDPHLARQLFTANTDDVGNINPNLSRMFGPGSVFALDGAEHRRRRKLLTPPFHGKSIKNYEAIFEEETLRESASWVDGVEFETLEPMNRLTLNVILRAVFGADGEHLDELRAIIPPWVTLGSKLVMLPVPTRGLGPRSPWGRLAEYRRQYDDIIDRLIADVKADPNYLERDDVLTLLLRSTYEDGAVMSNREIADEMLTLLAAGHETTASTLAWVFERVARHPGVLDRLAAEALTDDNEYRQAVILETQRARTVIDGAARHVYAPSFELGDWTIPKGYQIRVDITHIHARAEEFPHPERFDPQRYVGERPPTFAFLPFGGGTRRCVGAAFANVEMDVVLRTILRHFDIQTTAAPDEKVHARGVAFTPKSGGRVVMRRRSTTPA
jgi:cytochrome P450 family 138